MLQTVIKSLEQDSTSASQCLIEALKDSETYVLVEERAEATTRLLLELQQETGWKLMKESSGCKTYFRQEEALSTMSFRVNKVVNRPMMQVLPVIAEVDLYKTWFPMMKETYDIKELSRSRTTATTVNGGSVV